MAKYRKKPIVVEAERTDKTVVIHDYIITGINGDKYPCKPDTFERIYEPVE